MRKSPTIIISGGGTGGHLFAGIAVADEWKKRYPDSRILFVGAKGAIEERMVPRAGYPLEVLSLGSLKRVSMKTRLTTLARIPIALAKSAGILLRERPAAVFGIGGYASGPMLLMASVLGWIWGAKTAIIEQNAVPGFTNRILGRFAQQVFCAFPGIDRQFARAKTKITGNPVRKEMTRLEPANTEPFRIFITGGSQGAVGMNTLVLEALSLLSDHQHRIRILHQTGERDFERVSEYYRNHGWGDRARVEKFVYDMRQAYAEASLLVCRSGSSTLSEIAAVRRAAILFPLPTAADDHQRKNAELFSERGAARVMNQTVAKPKEIAELILKLMSDPAEIRAMEEKVAAFDRPQSSQDIVSALASAPGR